ncbi:MAG TPA: hypothetical protein VLK89_03960 [Solirubrobacterales bacterium]|nr:hypothetical protein [Solirubrobacterales bacterium]
MGRWLGTVAGAALAMSLLCVSSAAAATGVGGTCVANASAANSTVLSLSRGGSIPSKVPAAGVVTGWKLQVGPGQGPVAQRLQVFQPLAHTNLFITQAISETETVVEGANSFATRIPVEAGDRVGLYGPVETLFCDGDATDTSGLFKGEAPVGFPQTFSIEQGLGTPVTALVEPDVDGDGYGDESQDKCPQSDSVQVKCRPVSIDVTAVARDRSILFHVNVDARASVQVFGQVGWGFKPNPKAPGHTTRLIIALRGNTKTVVPGKTAVLGIRLPKAVLRRLGRLTPDESVRAKIAVIATSRQGVETVRRLRVKLKGQEGVGNLRG